MLEKVPQISLIWLDLCKSVISVGLCVLGVPFYLEKSCQIIVVLAFSNQFAM